MSETHERVEVEAVEAEGSVAVHHQHALARVDDARRHAEAGAHAKRPERARPHELRRPVHRQHLRREADDVAAVADDGRVLVDELRDLVAEAQRVDRVGVGCAATSGAARRSSSRRRGASRASRRAGSASPDLGRDAAGATARGSPSMPTSTPRLRPISFGSMSTAMTFACGPTGFAVAERKSIIVPAKRMTSASPKAVRRVRDMNCGWSWCTVPRPMSLRYIGACTFSASSRKASPASAQ